MDKRRNLALEDAGDLVDVTDVSGLSRLCGGSNGSVDVVSHGSGAGSSSGGLDGSSLGGEQRIDSLSQSWAAFCPYADRQKVKKALKLCLERLVDHNAQLVKIFDPPFGDKDPYLGYISSYGEGFRENGGQYTHAAIWLAMACFKAEMADEGFEILHMLLPENHEADIYGAEPFVLAADVYSAMGHRGEAGWTWYTGSAGWYFRAVTESLLGLKMENGRLKRDGVCSPCIDECRICWQDSKNKEHIIDIYPH